MKSFSRPKKQQKPLEIKNFRGLLPLKGNAFQQEANCSPVRTDQMESLYAIAISCSKVTS